MAHLFNQNDTAAIVNQAKSIYRHVETMNKYKAAYDAYVQAEAKVNALKQPYEQLELDGVSDAEKQRWLFIATQRAVFSYECYEPYLAVYDKVYKNMGFGNGIFSWCKQQGKK